MRNVFLCTTAIAAIAWSALGSAQAGQPGAVNPPAEQMLRRRTLPSFLSAGMSVAVVKLPAPISAILTD